MKKKIIEMIVMAAVTMLSAAALVMICGEVDGGALWDAGVKCAGFAAGVAAVKLLTWAERRELTSMLDRLTKFDEA